MPHNNSSGDFAHGVGGALANVNNRSFAIGGVGGWMDDETVGFASGQDLFDGRNWCASKYHRPSHTFSRLSDPPSGANHMYCGGGHAAWWWGVTDPPGTPIVNLRSGLYSTTGFRSPVAGLLGMGPDAAIAYKPDYQSNGPTRVRELDGRDWLLTEGHAYDLQLLGNGRAVWMEGFTLRSVGFDVPPLYTSEGGIWKPCAAFAGGRWWISYFSGKHGIVLHPFDSFDGFHVLAKGNGWHTISALGPDTIRATISTGIAEQAGQIWGLDYHVVTGEVTEITSGERVPASEERVDIRTINAFDLTPLNRPLWLGFFEFGIGPTSPGNCTLAVRNLTGPQVRPVILTDETIGKVSAPVVGYWFGGSTVEEIELRAAQIASATWVPVAYWDARRWPRLPKLPNRAWLALQAYCRVQETVDDFEADMRRVLDTIPVEQRVALVAQCYTSNSTQTTNLRALVPVYNRLALDYKNIIAVLPFTGAGRATGLPDHPEVRPLWEEFAAGIPSAPLLQEIPTMQLPRFTISQPTFPIAAVLGGAVTSIRLRCVAALEPGAGEPEWIEWQYAEQSKDGPWITAVRNPGGDKDHTFEIKKTGTFWFRALAGNSAGKHRTGLERKLTITTEAVPEPEPIPEPEPVPDAKENFFETSNGHFLSARVDQPGVPLTATGEGKGPFERLEIVLTSNEPTKGGIRSLQNNRFLRAVGGGSGDLFFDRDTIGTDETFEFLPGEDNRGLSIRSRIGRNLTAEGGGGGAVHARDEDTPQSWETFISSRPVLARGAVRRTGLVRPDGCALRDDQGSFRPLGLTFFWAMQGWKHERDRFMANAEWAAKFFDYERILTEVGWVGREIDPSSPQWSDWGTVLREVMDYFSGLGQRLELTLLGKGTNTDPMWLAREVATIVGENRQHMVIDIETCNEYPAELFPAMQAMARELKARTPNIIALSSPGDGKALKAAAREIGISGYTVHWDRGSGDYKWRQVRQPYDANNFKPLVTFANEPAGPGSSVSTQTNPLQLAMTRAVGIMCGAPAYVLHTGTGVFGDGKPHPTAGARPPNFWEIENIEAMISALRGVETLLPEGVENWQVQISRNTSSGSRAAPFTPHNHWEGNTGDGVNKAYSALAGDGRWILMPCGVRGHVVLTASYPLTEVVVYDPISLQPISGLKTSFDTGEVLDLPGGGEDAMVAYIIHGRR